MPAASLEWAVKALAAVRSNRGYGSANKRRQGVGGPMGVKPGMDRGERQQEAQRLDDILKKSVGILKELWNSPHDLEDVRERLGETEAFKQALTVLQPAWQKRRRTLDDYVRALVQLSQGIGTGTCDDYAFAAYVFLLDNDVRPIATGGLTDGDHGFAILGLKCKSVEEIEKPFETWGVDVFICDPWANIACTAPDYHEKWTQKMHKWSDQGKEIDTGTGWISPLKDDWILAIDRSPIGIVFSKNS